MQVLPAEYIIVWVTFLSINAVGLEAGLFILLSIFVFMLIMNHLCVGMVLGVVGAAFNFIFKYSKMMVLVVLCTWHRACACADMYSSIFCSKVAERLEGQSTVVRDADKVHAPALVVIARASRSYFAYRVFC